MTATFNGTEIAQLITEVGPILLAVVGLVGSIIALAVAFMVIGMIRGILSGISKSTSHAIGKSM